MSPVLRINASGPQFVTAVRHESRTRWLVLFLAALLATRLLFMAWLPLTDTTEARYAEIARKMLETGDWITPQFDYGLPFWGKPPLHTWLAAGGMAIFGVSAFAARLPILLVSISVLIVVYWSARRTASPITSLLSVVIASSTVLFFGAAAFVMTDMVMVLGTTFSMAGFYFCCQTNHRAKLWGYLFFVGLAIGLLSKGPTALVLTALPCGAWLIAFGKWHSLARLPWIAGLALTVFLVVPWYGAAELRTPGFLRYFLIGEHFERFLKPGWTGDLYGSGHEQPKGMIWAFGLAVCLPWTPLTLWLAFRNRSFWRSEDRDWIVYLVLWFFSPMVLFSPAANILPAYVLPSIPAFAILTARLILEQSNTLAWSKRMTFVCCAVALFGFLTITALTRVSPESIGLRSYEALVKRAYTVDSNIRISVFPARSYSAEFYTRGRAIALSDIPELSELADNNVLDAVIVPNHLASQVMIRLGSKFEGAGYDHNNHLFVERAPK